MRLLLDTWGGIQTPTNPSVGTIDQRIRSRSLEAV
jgi:hypothetical protein